MNNDVALVKLIVYGKLNIETIKLLSLIIKKDIMFTGSTFNDGTYFLDNKYDNLCNKLDIDFNKLAKHFDFSLINWVLLVRMQSESN